MVRCNHLDATIGSRQTGFGLEPEYRCNHAQHDVTTIAECLVCNHWFSEIITANKPPTIPLATSECRHPPGVIVDRYDRESNLADLFKGASAFLVLGGPSTADQPLELLGQRGVLIMSLNNCPSVLPPHIRPHIWLHTDPARKFHDSIWKDPGILKIVPVREWNLGRKGQKALRTRDENGNLVPMPGVHAKQMPGLLGFHRNTAFFPEQYLYEATINRGNDEKHATGMKKGKKVCEPNGYPKTINTMFAAVRMAFYLGIETLYLLGADFRMEKGREYGFNQGKGDPGIKSNNNAYASMCVMFDALKPHFDAAGFKVVNCTPTSGLWTFPFLPFEEAIAKVTDGFEQTLNAENWYDPLPK
jgi:hypothetical protein